MLSIAHRVTGVALSAGLIGLVYWLMSLAAGPDAYANAQQVLGSWLGKLILLGFTFALFYHFCNGIRHLCWDIGLGFEIETVYTSGWIVVGVSIGLTVLTWIVALA